MVTLGRLISLPRFMMQPFSDLDDISSYFPKRQNPYPTLKIYRSRPDAVFPTRAHPTDSGLDVTLIGVAKKLSDTTSLYHTGLHLEIPAGYHVKLYPRSSLHKFGYALANSVGLIDEQYRGELLIALTQVDPALTPLTFHLPFKAVQMVMEKRFDYNIVEIDELNTTTDRGVKGFGSSGV